MTAATFEAIISAADRASAPLHSVAAQVHALGKEADAAGKRVEGMEHPGLFRLLGGHVKLLRHQFHELGDDVKETGESITERLRGAVERFTDFLPGVAALGGLGSLGGLFELANSASEAATSLGAAARAAGTTRQQLADLQTAATLSDVSVESANKSIERMNRRLGDAAAGKNKDVAALLAHVGISMKQMRDQGLSAVDILPRLADAFAHTKDETLKARAAYALMGRSGMEMLPLLDRGGEEMKEFFRISREVNFVPDKRQYGELERYHVSWLELTMSVKGFTDLLGAKLAPELQPVIDQMREWIVANRDWLTSKITDDVHELIVDLRSFDWKKWADDIRSIGRGFLGAVGDVGGFRRLIEILIALKLASWTIHGGAALVRLARHAKEAKEGFNALKDAIIAAGAAETWAGLLGALRVAAALIAPIAAFVAVMWPTKTAPAAQDEAPKSGPRKPAAPTPDSRTLSRMIYDSQPTGETKNLWNLWGLLTAPRVSASGDDAAAQAALGMPIFQIGPLAPPAPGADPLASPLRPPPAASPAPAPGGEVRVQVDINNLPPGSRVNTTSSGMIEPQTTVRIGLGYDAFDVGPANPAAHGY